MVGEWLTKFERMIISSGIAISIFAMVLYNWLVDPILSRLVNRISPSAPSVGKNTEEAIMAVVIIGVGDDTKEVRGLKRDYDTMGGGRDKFASQVMDVISDRINQTFASRYVEIEFCGIGDQDICARHVKSYPNALTVNEDEFYIRQGSSSQALTKDEAFDYLSDRWDN